MGHSDTYARVLATGRAAERDVGDNLGEGPRGCSLDGRSSPMVKSERKSLPKNGVHTKKGHCKPASYPQLSHRQATAPNGRQPTPASPPPKTYESWSPLPTSVLTASWALVSLPPPACRLPSESTAEASGDPPRRTKLTGGKGTRRTGGRCGCPRQFTCRTSSQKSRRDSGLGGGGSGTTGLASPLPS